jgi:hypothetical protein
MRPDTGPIWQVLWPWVVSACTNRRAGDGPLGDSKAAKACLSPVAHRTSVLSSAAVGRSLQILAAVLANAIMRFVVAIGSP